MKTFRTMTLVFCMLVTVANARAGEGVLVPGGDRTPPPPPPASSPVTTDAADGETGDDSDENLYLLYAAAIWLQQYAITILP